MFLRKGFGNKIKLDWDQLSLQGLIVLDKLSERNFILKQILSSLRHHYQNFTIFWWER